ncbi:winged helix-turn-helix domain-containing protein [uncultured Phocaeicola sp.]|jgi:hypothetical protein|uniref:winged helix-turn-helix domain-containing protein n=1 Tax=uncultured Phocaeicola sp. TaxID=990718 RepID=UPI0015B18728|nr:winged helix-turn-helix domain-containing protein [uncultured Phocaeicola sp.]
MDIHAIGTHAGTVWRLLSNQKKWSYNELKSASGLADRELNAAIGWLAREGKIEIESGNKPGDDIYYLLLNVYI